jgi:hypothetical protein
MGEYTTHSAYTRMETQTDQGDCIFLLTVFCPYAYGSESLCFFTDYERALSSKKKLQEVIDAYEKSDKEYSDNSCIRVNPILVKEYGKPIAEVVKVLYSDFDKVTTGYTDIVTRYKNPWPLQDLPSSGRGCWFDFLKSEKKGYEQKQGALCETIDQVTKGTQTRFQAMYVVTDFMADDNYLNSQVIGVFTDPELAQDAQAKVAKSYGVVHYSSFGDKNFVELVGFTSDENINPHTIEYRKTSIIV